MTIQRGGAVEGGDPIAAVADADAQSGFRPKFRLRGFERECKTRNFVFAPLAVGPPAGRGSKLRFLSSDHSSIPTDSPPRIQTADRSRNLLPFRMAELRRQRHVEFAAGVSSESASVSAPAQTSTCHYCGPHVRAAVKCTDCDEDGIDFCAACDHRVHSFQGSEQLAAHFRVPFATESVWA